MTTTRKTPGHDSLRNKYSAKKVAKRKQKAVLGKLNIAVKLTDNDKSEDPSAYDRPPNLPTPSVNGKETPLIYNKPSSPTKPSYSSIMEATMDTPVTENLREPRFT